MQKSGLSGYFYDEAKSQFVDFLLENNHVQLKRILPNINAQELNKLLLMLSPSDKEASYEIKKFSELSAAYENNEVKLTVYGEYRNTQKGKKIRSEKTVKLNPFTKIDIETPDGKTCTVAAAALILQDTADSLWEKEDDEVDYAQFKNLPAQRQLQKIYGKLKDVGTDFSSADSERGALSAHLREYVSAMKKDELFNLDKDFMNEELRDVLNLNEDGSEIYLLEKVINASGWFEFPSFKAACHQHGHLRTQSGKPLFNAKFGNKDGRETVFYADYKIVTGYPDKGTFNYAVPEGSIFSESSLQHKAYDVDPFYPLMESLGYDFNLASDVMSWGWESFWKESAYLFGYNTEVWDVLRDEKVYKDKLMSKKKEFELLRENSTYAELKQNGFKGSGKMYPQSYIDFFIKESKKL